LLVPQVAETGPISITLGPLSRPPQVSPTTDFFSLPEYRNAFPSVLVRDSDTVVFDLYSSGRR